MKKSGRISSMMLAMAGAMACHSTSWAGRPLATEDAGVNDKGSCQLEAWRDFGKEVDHTHIAPACGVMDGLELGIEFDMPSSMDLDTHAIVGALKWAPESLAWNGWRFGAKLSTTAERAAGESERHHANWTALGIATYPINDQVTVHVNLGHAYDKLAKEHAEVYGAAITFSPHEKVVLFAELNGDNQSPATQSAGLRYWLIQDSLGLDITTSRTNATPDSQTWGIGFGWYGLKF